MAADEPTEAEALALWCALLPELRERARAVGVVARLDREAARVRDGGSARRAVRKWLADEVTEPVRTWSDRPMSSMVGFPGAPRPPSVRSGGYGCPLDRCERTAGRDPQGHPPVCHAFGMTMRPTS